MFKERRAEEVAVEQEKHGEAWEQLEPLWAMATVIRSRKNCFVIYVFSFCQRASGVAGVIVARYGKMLTV